MQDASAPPDPKTPSPSRQEWMEWFAFLPLVY